MRYGMCHFEPRKINSATKYPSIPTYHTLDPKTGVLAEPATPYTGTVIGTEKIDGANARIIVFPSDDWIIGSRSDLLTARGDFISNHELGLVDSLRNLAIDLSESDVSSSRITTFYLELYGLRSAMNWKNYSNGTPAWRLFDVALTDPAVFDQPVEKISSWRQHGGQEFFGEGALLRLANAVGLAVTPRLFELPAGDLPPTIEGMAVFLKQHSLSTLAAVGDQEPGRSEGIVLRTPDRSIITKARHQDYNRALRVRKVQEDWGKTMGLTDVVSPRVVEHIEGFLADPDSGVRRGRSERAV